MFDDKLEQLVALVVSERDNGAEVRRALDETAQRRLPDYARVSDFVIMATSDPRVAELFTLTGRPRRDLIWPLLVASIGSLTVR